MTDIGAWLSTLGLGQFADLFRNNLIDVDVLPDLSEADLESLGLPLGARKKIIKAASSMVAVAGLATAPKPLGRIAAPAATGTAERRQLTVMFVDLVGSTALSARLDPEEMGAVLRGYQNAVAGEIVRFEGHVAKFMGDGVLAYFGWPVAHEDEAERAVRAGLAIVAAVARLSGGAAPLACRIGVATGLVVVGELIGEGVAQEQTVVGDTPNLAARLQGLAVPGQVVVAAATRRLLGGGFELDELGAKVLRGIDRPVQVFSVVGERTVQSRFEAKGGELQPIVGRDQELALLLERWAQAKAGEGQAVLLVGEAGVGKSRISRALLDALGAEPHIQLRYQCSPYHGDSALWPVIRQLGHAASIDPAEPIESRLDKVEGLLARAGQGLDAAPLIAELLGIEGVARYGESELGPQAKRARTLEALTRQLVGSSDQQPVLVLLEDAHWIDPTTLELVELCLDAIAAAPVLMVLTSRPDRQPALAGHPHVTRLSLSRLGRVAVEAIVRRLAGERLPASTIEAIVARTDGVPLFVEELTKAVLETGETAIPASLHDSLMARLDRTPEVKEVAQIAACIGREFDFSLLAAVAGRPEAELAAALDKLVVAELVFRRGTPPRARCTFNHALVRDAAYESLLKSRLRQIHGRIADALERSFSASVETEPELIARHLAAAGHAMAAAHYWERAGARATDRSAFVEAVNHYGRGLDLLDRIEDDDERQQLELALRIGLGDALCWTRGFAAPEVEAAYSRAQELSGAMTETTDSFRILWGIWHFHLIRGDLDRAQELSLALAELGQRLQSPGLAPHVHHARGESCLWRGEFSTAVSELSKPFRDPAAPPPTPIPGVQEPMVMCGIWRAMALWHLGYPDQATAGIDVAVEMGRQSNHVGDLGAALYFAAWIRLLCRDLALAVKLAEESLRFNAQRGIGLHEGASAVLLGSAMVVLNGDQRGLDLIVGGNARARGTGAGIFEPFFRAAQAQAHGRLADPRAGLDVLADAAAQARRRGERWHEAEILRIEGELMLMARQSTDEAERRLLAALKIARQQEAKSLELRSATSLARLWAERGERQKARDLLAPVHGWFTEGFATLDLVEAKLLLEELQ